MLRKLLMTTTISMTLWSGATPIQAQGVPVIDGSNLGQLIAQVNHMAQDLNVQLDQLVALKEQLETEIEQLFNLEEQLKSLIDSAGVGELLATVADFKRLAGSLEDPLKTIEDLASGNFLDAFKSGSSLGKKAEALLTSVGLDTDELSGLASSGPGPDSNIARQAGAGAMLSTAAEEAHEQAGDSLDRLRELLGHVDDQEGVKAAIDVNTRVTAEIGVILTQMWRLEAAAGVAAGQLGVVDAATLAAERKFRTMEVPE